MNKPALLVVDDDPQVLAAVRRDLRSRYRQQYTVISASSGEEALATIKELKARGDSLAIVVSDQRMPGLQGTNVLAQSREIYPLARRVLLTAYSDIDAAIKAINVAHLDHYLSKPWDPPEEGPVSRHRRFARRLAGSLPPGRNGSPTRRAPMVAANARDQEFSRRQSHSVPVARCRSPSGRPGPARRSRHCRQ